MLRGTPRGMEILILLMAFDTKIMMLVNKGLFSEKKKIVNKGLRSIC
jgi:hypothetical protein